MSSDLPDIPSIGPSSQPPSGRALRAYRTAMDTVYLDALGQAVRAERELARIDAATDVVRYATEREVAFLDQFLAVAAGSPAKAALVARRAALLSGLNDSHIAAAFRN